MLHLGPSVRHRDETLRARLVPLQRPAERARERRHDEILRRRLELGAEASTHLWVDDADQFDGEMQCLRELSPYPVDEL